MIGAALAAFLLIGPACETEPPSVSTETPEPTVRPTEQVSTQATISVSAPAVGGTLAPPAIVSIPPSRAAAPPAATDPAAPSGQPMVAADFPAPPDRDLPELARQLRWNGVEPDPEPPRFAGQTLAVGDTTEFWTLDYPRNRMVSKEFVLAAVSDHAYWWIEDGLKVDDEDLQRAVTNAEAQVYPRVTAAFGSAPGSAADPQRGHIINGRIPGVGGYVSGADPYPPSVQPFSNGVPAIYINAREVPLGSRDYTTVLAHELQHAIHWYADPAEATWLNEGLSELAVTEAGYSPGSISHYLRHPNASLVNWPAHLEANIGLNYGAAALFAHYLREKYAPGDGLLDLLAGSSNGVAAVDAYLAESGATTPSGDSADFHAVFADWMVANLLDHSDGPYGYASLDVAADITRTARLQGSPVTVSLPQYGMDYVELKDVEQAATLHFEADGVTPLLPTDVPAGGCWWTNRGDDTSSSLTRSVTVPAAGSGTTAPELTFDLWYDIEEDWDYLYVEISTDGGQAWEVLPADGTTDTNPLGNSYGHGYTGKSGWEKIDVPLSDYAGSAILVRFHYVTDDAIHGIGACVRDMAMSWEPAGASDLDWQPDGFVRVNNQVRQDWIVWVIRDGAQPTATRMELAWDAEAQRYAGHAPLPAATDGERLVVAVAPVAPATLERAHYRLSVIEGVLGPPSIPGPAGAGTRQTP